MIFGLVVVARLIGNTFLVGISKHRDHIATVASAGITAIEHILDGEESRRPGTIALDVDSIGQRASGTMGPARTTVLRNMLISGCRQIVDTVDVSPIPAGWQIFNFKVLVRSRIGPIRVYIHFRVRSTFEDEESNESNNFT